MLSTEFSVLTIVYQNRKRVDDGPPPLLISDSNPAQTILHTAGIRPSLSKRPSLMGGVLRVEAILKFLAKPVRRKWQRKEKKEGFSVSFIA